MRTIRQIIVLLVVMMALCIMPCLLPDEILESVAAMQYDGLITAQMNGGRTVDISDCQNSCRMRYGSSPRSLPPTGFSDTNDLVAGAEAPGATVEQNDPILYTQCMEDCGRNYRKQPGENTKGSRRGR